MQPILRIIAGGLLVAALLQAAPGQRSAVLAQSQAKFEPPQCTAADFAKAVNDAGAALRKLSADNTPRLQAKMGELKVKRKWPEIGYQERAYLELGDERVDELDAATNTLLARVDALGTLEPGAAPECGRLQELQAASLELQATVKTKTAYLISKIDQMIAAPVVPPQGPAPGKAKLADAKPDAPGARPAAETRQETKPAAPPRKDAKAAEPKVAVATVPPLASPPPPAAKKPSAVGTWSTETTGSPPSPPPSAAVTETALTPLPPPEEGTGDGYSIEEIKAASAGFFGQVSANLASVIEHLFSKSGRPTGYILGTEGGGAFIAGVRYGDGTLYMRSGGTSRIYWHGPSVGFDAGAAGSKTLFLIYKLTAPEELYANFTGIDGSAYLVGGVGVTLLGNGNVVLAPIRSGVGVRLGASLGYLRFTPRKTWNPF